MPALSPLLPWHVYKVEASENEYESLPLATSSTGDQRIYAVLRSLTEFCCFGAFAPMVWCVESERASPRRWQRMMVSLTDGAGPNFSDLIVASSVAEGTRDGWWRGDEEVIAVILAVDGYLFFVVMSPISRAQATL